MNQNLIFPAVVLGILLLFICYRILRKRYARKKVRSRSDYNKIQDINQMVEPYGFLLDPTQEIFCSKMNAWQREYGYSRLYDEMATAFFMMIDCEPVTFSYDDRNWLIEFWKGQYGILSGGEIGIYVNDKEGDYNSGAKYEAVTDEERLPIEFTLEKEKSHVLRRSGLHWWLTGFKTGFYSSPSRLCMKWKIRFPMLNMRDAFLEGLYAAGYESYEIRTDYLTVGGCFHKPKRKQPRKRNLLVSCFVKLVNYHNCRLFCRKTKCFKRLIDKIDYLRYCYPLLSYILLHAGMVKKHKKVEKRKGRKKR